ncbi:Atrazine chlorohydrolase/guanine deaminase [Phaffia rhodozyma]|uniref:Atrazine chlorohydrolase/guanine deaminase n=1 Tax=Phaffia rhodozyma TaxID=264483 RepID=A0A0F7SP88_PHARH|nr:Atrazine chlorohydrolase/guanine deaminase [Phaffia rhodozyma]
MESEINKESCFLGTFIHTPTLGSLEILEDHLLLADSQGYISFFGPQSSKAAIDILNRHFPAGNKHVLPPSSFFLPSFSDLHIHAPQYLYAGTGLDLPLMEWLERYAFRAEQRIDGDKELAERVYERLGRRMIEVGTGAALVFGTINTESNLILARTFLKLGIRGYIGKLSMDQNSPATYTETTASNALSAASTFIDSIRSLNEPNNALSVHPVITPRFVPTCSDELLQGLGKLREEKGVRVMSHMCEARDQVDWVKATRDDVEDVEIFKHTGLLESSVQAHCTFLTPENIELISHTNTAVAHCPLSNAYFSSKTFPLRECLDKNIHVGLGSDIAGGYQLDLQTQMRQAVVASRLRDSQLKENALGHPRGQENEPKLKDLRSSWKESLYMATRGGALALADPNVGGRFKVGEAFDAQSIELLDPQTNEGTGALDFFDVDAVKGSVSLGWEEMIERWWCVGDVRNRKGLWVQGRQLL